MSRLRLGLWLFILLATQCPLPALAAGQALFEPLTDQEKQAFGANYLLPSPAEVFVALEKAGPVDWTAMASFNPRYDYADNSLRALNLGIRAADGFLAIQARDHGRLGDMITVIMTLAEELLVQDTILAKGQTFEKLSRGGEWDRLHTELDILRDDVMREMERMGDQDIALLVAAGGWLEGLRATAKSLQENYNERASTLLYQPKLVNYFKKRLAELQPSARSSPAVIALMAGLEEIGQLVDVGFRNPVPRENVAKVHALSAALVRVMEGS